MPNPPKVSVILTSYNHAKYLREAIDSVLNQTFTDFELIIWDDASTDESWQIISSYNDPRIRSFRNERNQRGRNVRRAIEQVVRGGYIGVNHSDDVWFPDKLDKQVALLSDNPQIGAVFSHAQIIDENGARFTDESNFYYAIFEQPNRTRHEWLNFFFYHGNALCHPSMLIRRQCYKDVGLYRYGLAQIPDFDMWVRLCMKYDIHVLPEKLTAFRVRSDELNTSGNRPETHARHHFELLYLYENYLMLEKPEEFLKVFPDMQKYFKKDQHVLRFALAMTALEPKTYPAAKLFGLSQLFDLLNDPIHAAEIKEIYNFEHNNFIELASKYDVFSIKTIQNLNKTVRDLQIEKSILSARLQTITQSRAWKLASFLQKAWSSVRALFQHSAIR